MLKQERHEKILLLLDQNEYLTVTEISKLLNVSGMTIRRDISEMAEYNKLVRVYGGAQKLNIKEKEYSTSEKIDKHVEAKKYIGKVMNSLISNNSTIYLGAGTTIYYAVAEIKKENLKIVTNSLIAFNYLIENTEYEVILTGGEYNKITEEFIGEFAERTFENLNIDIAFAATNGIYHDNITTSNPQEGSIQRKAFEQSKVKVIVADSSKLNVSDVYTFYKLSDADIMITDNHIPQQVKDYYSEFINIIKEVI